MQNFQLGNISVLYDLHTFLKHVVLEVFSVSLLLSHEDSEWLLFKIILVCIY